MSSYAFRAGGGHCYIDRATGEHFHNYPDVILSAPEFARPIPIHAQTPAALAAVEAHRRLGDRTRAARAAASLVTAHGLPKVARYRGPIPANAHKLEATARAAGFETKLIETISGCRVEGYHAKRRVGFRATFMRGRADGASWHEPWRYGIVRDSRPVKVNAKTRTALKGYRPAGVGPLRLAILGSPVGVPITHTELNERIPA